MHIKNNKKGRKHMAKKKEYENLANSIIELVGGKSNIEFFTHCVTRLRFNLKDQSIADVAEIEKIKGVVGCQWQNNQLQIIIGQAVGGVYKEICEVAGLKQEESIEENLDSKKKKFGIGSILDGISGCLFPLIPALVGGGMLKVIILLLNMIGLLSVDSPTYITLSFVSDTTFYFLPVMVGASAAKKFGANIYLGIFIGAMLINPTFIELVSTGNAGSVFGIPIYAASYASTVFPVIMAVFVMSYVERFFARISPDAIRTMLEPVGTLLVMVPLTLCAIAPLGSILGIYLTDAIMWLYDTTGFLGIAILAALYPLMTITGMHGALLPVAINSFATLGYDPILFVVGSISNVNQGIASAAVALKTKDTALRSNALSSAITALFGGVTEPALFGVNLKLKKPLWCAIIGNFIGATYVGLMHVYCYVIPGIGGTIFILPSFVGPDSSNLINMIIGLIISIVVTFTCTFIVYKDEVGGIE